MAYDNWLKGSATLIESGRLTSDQNNVATWPTIIG